MGHVIGYRILDEDVNRNSVLHDICDLAEREGDGYTGNLTWHDDTIYANRRKAEDAIARFDTGWYSDHAVLFRDLESVEPTKEETALDARILGVIEKRDAYADANHVRDWKSAFVGCPECGSKVARPYISTNDQCPVCGASLLSDTVKGRLAAYDARLEKLRAKRAAAMQKNESKAPVKWLLKYEYHV